MGWTNLGTGSWAADLGTCFVAIEPCLEDRSRVLVPIHAVQDRSEMDHQNGRGPGR